MPKNKQINVRLPEDVIEALETLSAAEDKSRTEIVIEAVRLYRDKVGIQKPGSLLPEYVLQAIDGMCGTLQTNLNAKSNQLLSSMAIQLFVVQRMMADNLEVEPLQIEEYTRQAVEMIRQNNRVFRMQDLLP